MHITRSSTVGKQQRARRPKMAAQFKKRRENVETERLLGQVVNKFLEEKRERDRPKESGRKKRGDIVGLERKQRTTYVDPYIDVEQKFIPITGLIKNRRKIYVDPEGLMKNAPIEQIVKKKKHYYVPKIPPILPIPSFKGRPRIHVTRQSTVGETSRARRPRLLKNIRQRRKNIKAARQLGEVMRQRATNEPEEQVEIVLPMSKSRRSRAPREQLYPSASPLSTVPQSVTYSKRSGLSRKRRKSYVEPRGTFGEY